MKPEDILHLKTSVYADRAGCEKSLGESVDAILKEAGTYPLRWTGPELRDVDAAGKRGMSDLAIASLIQTNRKLGAY